VDDQHDRSVRSADLPHAMDDLSQRRPFRPNMFIDVTVGGSPPTAPPDQASAYGSLQLVRGLSAMRRSYVGTGGGDPEGDSVNECLVHVEGGTTWESGWITSTSVTPSGLGYYTYAWKVKCRNSHGAESDWSDTWHFSLASPDVHINDVHF